MNAKQRKSALEQLEKLDEYDLGLYTYGEGGLYEAMTYWESKKKAHRAAEGDGWVLWKAGKA